MSNDFLIEGYSDDCLEWGAYCPLGAPVPKSGVALRQWALEGPARQLTVTLTGDSARIPATGVAYTFQMLLDAASKKQARVLAEKGQKKWVLGLMKAGRFDADGHLLAQKVLVLEGLDEQHLLDRLLSETLSWHAKDFGPGPHTAEGQRALSALGRQGVLEARLPKAPVKPRVRM